jgi:hypothetical protein
MIEFNFHQRVLIETCFCISTAGRSWWSRCDCFNNSLTLPYYLRPTSGGNRQPFYQLQDERPECGGRLRVLEAKMP